MAGKIIISLLLLIPVPLVYTLIHILLDSSGGWLIMAFFTLIPFLGSLESILRLWNKRTKIFTVFALLTLLFMAVMIVGEILFLPYKAYELWFTLFRSGLERGRVSHLFVKLGSWFTALICWIILRNLANPAAFLKSLKKTIYMPLFFVYILWPSFGTAILALASVFFSRLEKNNRASLTILFFLALLMGLTGINTPAKGSKMIDSSSDNLIIFMTDYFPALPILYDVPLYGESLSNSIETGGRPTLTSNLIFTVQGELDDQLYLRSRVYRYPGQVSEARPLDELPLLDGEPGGISKTIPIRIMTDYINILPYTDNTIILETRNSRYELDERNKTILPEPPLFMDEYLTLYESRETPLRLVEDEETLALYTESHGPVSSQTKELARTLAGADQGETVRNIRTFLMENYVYSLDTEEREDYRDYFLFESREGYCLHFATSFVTLARLNGIPCRFAEGYLVNFPSYEDMFDDFAGGMVPDTITAGVSGLSSHVWPEIYHPEKGWIRYEATSPFVREDSPINLDRLTQRQLAEIRGDAPPEENPLLENAVHLLWLFFIPGGYILYRLLRRAHRKAREYTRKVSHVVKKYVRTSRRAGVSPPGDRGWISWAKEITDNIPEAAPHVKEALPLILQARYSEYTLTEENKSKLSAIYTPFHQACRKSRRY